MKRRFIAGAVCPQCQAVDRIAIEGVDDNRVRLCVACGFRETMTALPEDRATGGRFDRKTRDADAVVKETPVKILDPGSKP